MFRFFFFTVLVLCITVSASSGFSYEGEERLGTSPKAPPPASSKYPLIQTQSLRIVSFNTHLDSHSLILFLVGKPVSSRAMLPLSTPCAHKSPHSSAHCFTIWTSAAIWT